jgi:hypothetical protein
MATINPESGTLAKLGWYLDHHAHSVWDQFNSQQQQQMVEDDITAGISVSMLLVALITSGMLLSIITVLAVLATS